MRARFQSVLTQTRNYSGFAACPRCRQTGAKKVGFTWWGGIVGPAIICHVKCPYCGTAYNGKTGRSNDTAIVIYIVVTAVIGLGIVAMVALAGTM